MNGEAESAVDKLQQLRVALTTQSALIVPQLCEMIGYRKKIAELIHLGRMNESELTSLYEQLDYTNNTIKKLLGL